jgi:hypothetical protein
MKAGGGQCVERSYDVVYLVSDEFLHTIICTILSYCTIVEKRASDLIGRYGTARSFFQGTRKVGGGSIFYDPPPRMETDIMVRRTHKLLSGLERKNGIYYKKDSSMELQHHSNH